MADAEAVKADTATATATAAAEAPDGSVAKPVGAQAEFDAAAARAAALESKVLEAEYIKGSTGARVSSKAHLHGQKRLVLHRRALVESGAVLRADLAGMDIGQYTIVGEGTVLQPARVRSSKGGIKFSAITIRDHAVIGRHCVISAVCIGIGAQIGDGCVISERCVLHDYCKIVAGSVVPPDTVVPPFGVFEGVPAQLVEILPAGSADSIKGIATKIVHDKFG